MSWLQHPIGHNIFVIPGFWIERIAKILQFLSGLVIIIEVIGRERVEAAGDWFRKIYVRFSEKDFLELLRSLFEESWGSIFDEQRKPSAWLPKIPWFRWCFLCVGPVLAIVITFASIPLGNYWQTFLLAFGLYYLLASFSSFCSVGTILGLVGWFPRPGKTLGWLLTDLLKFVFASVSIFNIWSIFWSLYWNDVHGRDHASLEIETSFNLIGGYSLFSMFAMASMYVVNFVCNIVVLVLYMVFRLGIVPLFWICDKATQVLLKVMSKKGLVWMLLVSALLALLVGFSLDLFCS